MNNICINCGVKFDTYIAYEDCTNCNDGADDENNRCYCCGGLGEHQWKESKKCKNCLTDELTA